MAIERKDAENEIAEVDSILIDIRCKVTLLLMKTKLGLWKQQNTNLLSAAESVPCENVQMIHRAQSLLFGLRTTSMILPSNNDQQNDVQKSRIAGAAILGKKARCFENVHLTSTGERVAVDRLESICSPPM